MLLFKKSAFESLIKSNPAVAFLVIQNLGNRIRQIHQSIKSFIFSDACCRLSQTLIEAIEVNGECYADGKVALRGRYTHQVLADLIGTTRQTESEIIAALKKQGLIKIERRKIIILNRAGLERLVYD